MLKHKRTRISYLSVGLAFALLSCVDAQDRAGSVEPGSGVRPGSSFAAAADQITVTLSEPTVLANGGLNFRVTVTNAGPTEVCIATYREEGGVDVAVGLALYDRTGQHALGYSYANYGDLVAVNTDEEARAIIAETAPVNGPNKVIPAYSTTEFMRPSLATASGGYLPFFCKSDEAVFCGGRERDYRAGERLTARSGAFVYPCNYPNSDATRESGEYVGITSSLVGPFAPSDGIFFRREERR